MSDADFGRASCLAVVAAIERGELHLVDFEDLAPPWSRIAQVAKETVPLPAGGAVGFARTLTPGWCRDAHAGGPAWVEERFWNAFRNLGGESTEYLVDHARLIGQRLRDGDFLDAAPAAPSPLDQQRGQQEAHGARGLLVPLSRVVEVDIEWLWDGRLPYGNAVVMAGDGGTGKSTIAQHIAAGVTRGEGPFGVVLDCPRDVVILTNEEDAAAVIRPRMRLMGADLDRVQILNPDRAGSLTLPRDGDQLAEYCDARAVGLIVVDTGPSFLDRGLSSQREEDIRAFLVPLQRIAQRHRAVALVLCHLNKATAANSRHRVMGGAAWVNAPRLVLLVGAPPGADPRETGDRLLAVEKSNLGVYLPAVSFALVSATEDHSRAVVRLDGDDSPRSALDEAVDFLREELKAGWRPTGEVKRAAAEAEIAWRTVERAKPHLGVTSRRISDGNGGAGTWMLGLPADPPGKAANLPGDPSSEGPWRSSENPHENGDPRDDAGARPPAHGNGGLADEGDPSLSQDDVIQRVLDAFPGSFEEPPPHAGSSAGVPYTHPDLENWRDLLRNGRRR
ncbi:MAG: AAA family ATPase [Longimicrobiales bacterium]